MTQISQISWYEAKSKYPIGSTLNISITKESLQPYGVLLKLDDGVTIILERISIAKRGYDWNSIMFAPGSKVNCEVIGYREYCREVELALCKTVNEASQQ